MNDKTFAYFVEMLKLLQKEDQGKNKIENVIVKLIDSNENDMTEEQKTVIIKKFLSYEMKRRGKSGMSEQRSSLSSSLDIDESNF